MLHDNDTENKLRQLDNGQEPDLSKMDDHWAQMQAMLQPAAISKKNKIAKTIPWGIIIGSMILVLAVFLYTAFNGGNRNRNVAANDHRATSGNNTLPAVVPAKDSVEKNSFLPGIKNTAVRKAKVYVDAYFSEDDSAFANMKINFTPCENCPADNQNKLTAEEDKQVLLQQLFNALKKEAQQFAVDNSRDTILEFAAGTALLIPANSLGGKNGIVITVKEFYNLSDMAMNKLSTLSNQDQLISGGMLQINATLNGNEVLVNAEKPLTLYMTDSSSTMAEMQLFNGEAAPEVVNKIVVDHQEKLVDTASANNTGLINWIPQNQYFTRKKTVVEVRVLNIIDQPFKIRNRRGGEIGYFAVDYDSLAMDKEVLKQMLQDKYGYYKVRLRSAVRDHFKTGSTDREFDFVNSNRIGDSIWMDKQTADRYQLTGTATRIVTVNEVYGYNNRTVNDTLSKLALRSAELIQKVKNRYAVNIRQFGWINCDRFARDSREKIQYAVDLGDSAKNYYSMILFNNIKSLMSGYAVGNRVLFDDVPKGAKVTVISMGINRLGETVYTLQPAIIDTKELSGLSFQSTSTAELKTSLSKMDR